VGNGCRLCRFWNKKFKFIFCLTPVEGVDNVEGKELNNSNTQVAWRSCCRLRHATRIRVSVKNACVIEPVSETGISKIRSCHLFI
jgi:hypothetical protein